jgi:hypothetical protein
MRSTLIGIICLGLIGCASTTPESNTAKENTVQRTAIQSKATVSKSKNPIIDYSEFWNRHKVADYWTLVNREMMASKDYSEHWKASGCIHIVFTIGKQGKAESIYVDHSYPKGYFDQAAINAIAKRKWLPSEHNVAHIPVKTSTMFIRNEENDEMLKYCGQFR